MLNRREVVKQVLENRPANLFAVSGLGSPTWDVAAAGNHKNDFQFIGAMGQAGPFALGLALVQPEKRIVLITGDGELLMGLGTLATIGNQATENLRRLQAIGSPTLRRSRSAIRPSLQFSLSSRIEKAAVVTPRRLFV